MKLDSLVSYLNDEKINLNPVFQRGQAWSVGTRRKLIENVVQGRPIPAIFLYKEAETDSSRYSYNILDGKQRLESLILFIASQRSDLFIKNWASYFFPTSQRRNAKFWIQLPEGKKTFASLDPRVVRDFREYAIPTIEITLSDGSKLDEIISLFVDINQQGVQVSRFSVAKAMGQSNKVLRSVFDLLARKEKRGNAIYYKAKKNEFTSVLKRLNVIASAADPRAQVDRMWERLLEIVLFLRTGQHRKPVDILKSFIRLGRSRGASVKTSGSTPSLSLARMTKPEIAQLSNVFEFLDETYRDGLASTDLATDQTHFYTLVTSLISTDLMSRFDEDELAEKLIAFGAIIAKEKAKPKELAKRIDRYISLSNDRTTDSERRDIRRDLFVEIVSGL